MKYRIDELAVIKRRLEQEIKGQLERFEADTGVKIHEFKLDRGEEDNSGRKEIQVNISVLLSKGGR